jgi:hypothetical protein
MGGEERSEDPLPMVFRKDVILKGLQLREVQGCESKGFMRS